MKALSVLVTAIFCASLATANTKPKQPAKPSAQQIKPDVSVVDIKGVRLGLERAAVEEIVGNLYNYKEKNFTIAEVLPTSGMPPTTQYIDEKLSTFYFPFPSKDFESIRSAITSKYPMTRCTNSAVQNRMGASFGQVSCEIISNDGTLTLQKYGSSTESGNLMMISNAAIEKSKKAVERSNSDI